MELMSLSRGVGHAKVGFLGFAGSGKTYTAAKLAVALRAHQKLAGPVAMFDTEGGAPYIAQMLRSATGQDLIGVQSRALKDAVEFLRACMQAKASVAIIDSVSHLWRELCDSYLKQVNVARKAKGKSDRTRLEFQDWGPIKAKWAEFADLYLTAPLHVIIAGRAGYEYDYEEREEGGKDLVKTGIKMKTEGEFGYEPSLLIQMERVSPPGDLATIIHRATVLKDRFGVLDGKTLDNPDGTAFAPHYSLLTPGEPQKIDLEASTDLGVDDDGDAEWHKERRQRTIFAEEIEGLLVATWPGQSAEAKKARQEAIFEVLGTRSWTQVAEGTKASVLQDALERLRAKVAAVAGATAPADAKAAGERAAQGAEAAGAIGDHFAKPAPGGKPESKAADAGKPKGRRPVPAAGAAS